ncbi:MAG: hypothetical protein O3C43_13945 [Verrucomicrobia bacterium]|nr:hypothetical protein [Verrucomicrobiota bacterium]MDA1067593.1 hypothetical protein [Verrucomicrobiota bacterium]
MKLKNNYLNAISFAGLSLAILSNGLNAQDIEEVGKFVGDFRARLETADQDGRESSEAFTLRSRVGFESVDLNGIKFFIEGEDVRALDEDDYNPYPVAGKTVIADPVGTELNRAQISYSENGFTGIVGRQRIILDNARFVGNVGWRQNEQTYDAFTLKYADTESGLTGFYGYIDKVQRIFGDDAPALAMREFKSDSHLFNGSLLLESGVKLGAYAYLLDFSNSHPNSTDTYGFNVSGVSEVEDGFDFTYHAEYAVQNDAGEISPSYNTDYLHLILGTSYEGFTFKGGYEVLGSDNGVGFKTPLATLHAFNGWADAFLGTPGAGLEDLYFSVGTNVDKVALTAVYHNFSADKGGTDFGSEIDVLAVLPVNKQLKFIAKAAFYQGGGGIPGSDKLWLEADFTF